MQESDDIELLRQYAAGGSEKAFETLVSRRIRFVYSAALRQVRDPHLAEEIAQAVFIILAQKAAKISDKTSVMGWLFKTTRYVALAQIRTAARRRHHEKEAHLQSDIQTASSDPIWEQMSPLLDEALANLNEKDRQAVLLHFFENKSFVDVGASFGKSGDTARIRVTRALEKLRRYFLKRGVATTTAIIATAIAANSVHAEPVALAKTVTTIAISKGATSPTSTLTLIKGALKIMAWTKAKTAIIAGIGTMLVAGGTTTFIKYRNYQAEIASWRRPTLNSEIIGKAMPQVRILPTKFKPPVYGYSWAAPDKWAGVRVPVLDIVCRAYNCAAGRVVFPGGEPAGRFDFVTTLPQDAEKALQKEITKEFGLVGHTETRDMDVLVLKVRDLNNPGLKIYDGTQPQRVFFDIRGHIIYKGRRLLVPAVPPWGLYTFLEKFLVVPVIDETGLTNRYDLDIKWNERGENDPNHDALKQALIDQTGLELVPEHRSVEMLVMEKVK